MCMSSSQKAPPHLHGQVQCVEQFLKNYFKGCGMGPWLVLVSPIFREIVVSTCKIGSFLCSLDNFASEKSNCSLFWKSNFRMALI